MRDRIQLNMDSTECALVWGVWFARVVEEGLQACGKLPLSLFIVVVSDLMYHDSSAHLWWYRGWVSTTLASSQSIDCMSVPDRDAEKWHITLAHNSNGYATRVVKRN